MSRENSSMKDLHHLKQLLQEKSIAWGADLIGFANVERFIRYPPENHPSNRTKTVIVLAIWMEDSMLDLWLHLPSWRAQDKPSRAFEDEILRGVSLRLCLLLEREGFWAEPARYEPGLYLKEAGVLAGLGIIGKNNLLITDKYGPRIRLRAVNTSAPLAPDPILEDQYYCRNCNRCVDACPPNALAAGQYNRDSCLSYCQTHLREVSPHAVLWCMECSTVCPIGTH